MSNISCGIVGLPNVGKSTLFNALTKNNALAANYPFATIEPNTGVVSVPDERLIKLTELYKAKKTIPATVTFVDIAGLVSGASKGEGLGNQFLGHIRSCNAVIEVVRGFSDNNVQHVENRVDPKKDIELINTELVLADLASIQKKIGKFEKEARANPKLLPILKSLQQAEKTLNLNHLIYSDESINTTLLSDIQLITAKPIIYLFNVDEASLNISENKETYTKMVEPATAIFVCAKLEDELKDLDQNEAEELLGSYGQRESGLVQLIKASYKILGLQSFLTAGEKEVRAWTIAEGTTAQEAAGVIHTDFARGFISAEIVSYPDLIKSGSLGAARSAGLVRTEGKSYIMQPDDIVEFRFNV